MKETVKKHWNIFQINNEFKDVFPEPPIMCFHRNKNFKDFLRTKTIVNNKAQKVKLSNRKRYSIPCHWKTGNLRCKQMKHTNTFSSTLTKRTYGIYNRLNWKSSYLIYLMECTLCKRHCTSKSQTAFNIRLINHRNDVYKTNTLDNRHAKFALIEQLSSTELDKEFRTFKLNKREDFWYIN